MKFKLDFDDLEELQKLLGEVAESVEEFEDAFSNIIDEVMENSSGKALEKIIEISEELLPTLKDVAIGYQDQADIAKDYIEGIRDINEDKGGIYKLDTSEAKGCIKDITNHVEDIEYLDTDTPGLVYFTASYNNQVKSFYEIDGSLNLDEEYEDDEKTKALIRSKRLEINNYIANYNHNQTQLENAQDIMTELNKTMSSYIEDLADYKDVLEDLKDFEEAFNPGFWDKHGQTIKVIGTIATVVVVGAFLWEAGVVAIAGELLMSGGSAVWAASDMVLLGISEGAIVDGVTMGAELLVEEGAAWLSEAAIGAEISGTAIIDTLFESAAGTRLLKFYLYDIKTGLGLLTFPELYNDVKNEDWLELLTDLIISPFDKLSLLDNEILNYNNEGMNTIESKIQMFEELTKFDFEFNDDDTFVGNFI